MREKNVNALRALLEEALAASKGGYRLTTHCVEGDPARPIYDDPARLAEWLVEAGGVLVPGAVSEQEAIDLLHPAPAGAVARQDPTEGPLLRDGLRRIADDGTGAAREGGEGLLCLKGTHQWGVTS